MRKLNAAVALFAVGVLVIMAGGTAYASPAEETIYNWKHAATKEVNFYNNTTGSEPSTDGYVRWQHNVVDSPNDRGSSALHSLVPPANSDGSFYNLFYSFRSTNQNRAVGNVKNLSFDLRTNSSDGGGAPRISVEFLNGDVAYLASNTCRRELTVDSRWSRADFTGAKQNCGFYVSGVTGGFYEATGTQSAWDVYATAFPNQRVSQTYVVMDNPAGGNYWLDRIALGTAWSYTSGWKRGVRCMNNEYRC